MRYLLLMAIVLTSLCVDIPFLNISNTSPTGASGVEVSNDEIYMAVSALPSEISSGSKILLSFRVKSKAGYDLKDVNVSLYDPCVFSGESEKSVGTLEPNLTSSWTWELTTSGDNVLTRECSLKFNIEYKGKSYAYQDVAVLTQSEYNTRLMQGTLSSVPISSSYSSSPLKVIPTFNTDQPLVEGTNVNMQIDYSYVGSGLIQVGNRGITIEVPNNLRSSTTNCRGDYTCSGSDCSVLTLNKDLRFVNKRSTPTTCTFLTSASQQLEIDSMKIISNYDHVIDSQIKVVVKGTSPSQTSP
ncbi:MAG: hypothetical protein V1678_04930 [Candidatus Aenigmatarchaeota archaeon]